MTVAFSPRGVWTALATPFGGDGQVDAAAFSRLVRFQVAQGVTGVLPCGTTGESPTLDWMEHDQVIEMAVEAVDGDCGVLAGTGSNNTREAIRGTQHAHEAGVSAVLLVDCYYNGPSSLELRTEYYERILEAVPRVPVVPYVIPGRSGCALSAADVAALHLADPVRVPAVKEATGDLERMALERTLAGPSLAIFSGDDDLTLAMMADPAIGSAGVISVMSNIAPASLVRMVEAAERGDRATADKVAAELAPLLCLVTCAVTATRTLPGGRTVEVVDKFRNPVPVKTMMAGLGMLEPVFRAPLGLMTADAVAECRAGLREVWEAAPHVLSPIGEAFDVDVAARLDDDAVWSSLAR